MPRIPPLARPDLSMLLRSWPSPYVPREKVSEFSGGLITPKRLANLDSQGLGPRGRVRHGRKVAYPALELVRWLESRSELVEVDGDTHQLAQARESSAKARRTVRPGGQDA